MTVEDPSVSPFAGDLFLRLAAEGRLVLEPDVADKTIASLQDTLSQVRDRLWTLANTRTSDTTVEARFAEVMAPGRLAQAATELPKYIEAVRRARR